MDWKEDIGNYFASQNVFKVKYLNEKLSNNSKEYVDYINQFSGITASFEDSDSVPDFIGVRTTNLKIEIVTGGMMKRLFPFKISCYYDGGGNLFIKHSIGIDMAIALSSNSNRDSHIYKEEVITDPERTEKEFVFQLLNNRLKHYIDSQDN